MTAAALHHVAPRCERCLYSLDGLGDRGRCPECGKRFEHAEPAAESIDDRKTRLNADLALRRFNGPPSLRQQLAPLLRPAALVLFLTGAAATLIWIGWQTVRAINYKLGWFGDHYRPPRPSTTGSIAAANTAGEVILVALRCAPCVLLALAIAVAFVGLSLRRVPLAPGTTLTGNDARGLGAFALAVAIVLAGALYAFALSA